MMLQNSQIKVLSEHSSISNFVCFNHSRDKFITCGQDGDMHAYFLQSSQVKHVASRKLFEQAIACVSWANMVAGDWIAVSGSKGSLIILHINNSNGQITIQHQLNFKQSTIVSLDWHPQLKKLICGTIDSKVIKLHFKPDSSIQQEILEVFQPKKDSQAQNQIQVAYGVPQSGKIYVCCGSNLYGFEGQSDFKKLNLKQIEQRKKLSVYFGETIKKMLIRTQRVSELQKIIILTEKGLYFNTYNYKDKPRTNQKMAIGHLKLGTINWGWSQNQIIGYSLNSLSEKISGMQKNKSTISNIVTFRRQINGTWTMQN